MSKNGKKDSYNWLIYDGLTHALLNGVISDDLRWTMQNIQWGEARADSLRQLRFLFGSAILILV